MNTISRVNLDTELERLYELLKGLEPASEEYANVTNRIKVLTELANSDDERSDTALSAENKQKLEKRAGFRTFIIGLAGVGVTALSWIGTWYFNERAQDKAHDFESDYAYTSKARQWCTREPSKR